MSDWSRVYPQLLDATGDTLYMVGVATLLTVLLGIPLTMVIAIALAVALSSGIDRFRSAFRVGFYAPVVTSIVAVSVVSRVRRSFELRATVVELDRTAQLFLRDAARRTIRLVANEPNARDAAEYQEKRRDSIRDYGLDETDDIIFVEITVTDPSGFASRLDVQGHVMHGHYRVLTMEGTNVPNALGALLLHVRDETKRRPHLYVEWTEGNPLANLARFLFLGVGEVAPTTREVLRRAEPDRDRRPYVHTA